MKLNSTSILHEVDTLWFCLDGRQHVILVWVCSLEGVCIPGLISESVGPVSQPLGFLIYKERTI